LGGGSQAWLAAEGGAAPTAASAALFFLAPDELFFLAASAAGLRIRTIADAKHKTADDGIDRGRVDVMGNLSNAKVSPGSRDSAGHHLTVKVSERGKVAELGPTMTFTVPVSTDQPLVS